MALQSVVRWLIPKEDRFYTLLEQQAAVCLEVAQALARFKEPNPNGEAVRDAVQELEHKGDGMAQTMEDELARTFVTPIDREDLYKLSSELDDIIDMTNLAARAAVLYGVTRPTEPMVKLIDLLVATATEIKDVIPRLRTHDFKGVLEGVRKVRALEKDADTVFRSAISNLFKDPSVDAKVLLREKEVLEDLENAVDHCDDVGDTLAHLAVKHG